MKLVSWNVNGLRSVYGKGLVSFVKKEKPDILCLQETKLGHAQLDKAPPVLSGYSAYYSGAEKKGYSGVATYIKHQVPFEQARLKQKIGVSRFDSEGRFLITYHKKFILYNVYIPSGTTGEVRQDFKYEFLDSFLDHLNSLPKSAQKKLVICGDFNICHRAIDIHHPQEAEKRGLSGFLPDERLWMDRFVERGFLDTFRVVHGDVEENYSWWTFRAGARSKNLGWRIDYFFVSRALKKNIKSAAIRSSVMGSDHCPITLELEI